MPIKVGDRVPNATFRVMTGEGPKPKTSDDIFKGKKVACSPCPALSRRPAIICTCRAF